MTNKSGSVYEFGPFRLNPAEGQLHRDGQLVQITPKAFEALVFFVERPGRLISKEDLLQALWPDSFVEEANLTHHVWRLRTILSENKEGTRYIETVPKRGYRFAGEVTVNAEASNNGTPVQNVSPSPVNGEHLWLTPMPLISDPPKQVQPDKAEIVARPARITTRNLIAAGIIGVFFVTGVGLFWRARERNRLTSTDQSRTLRSLAVLPFKPLNAGSGDATLELGIADALITRLSNLKDISVRPTSAVLEYSAADLDLPATGRALQVESVLDGRVQRIGDRIRVTIQLIRSDDGKSLWAETFDEKYTDIFTLEDSLSAQVASALAIKLTGADVAQLKRHSTNNLEADQLYQLGRYHLNRGGGDATTKAVTAFEQAIEKDPEFALAFAGLASAHAALGFAGVDAASPGTEFGKAKKAAARALEIDNSLAEAHTALGAIAFHYDWNWPEAEKELKRAIELNPNLAEAHHEYSNYLAGMERMDECLREIGRARELDPLSLIINFHYGLALFGAGHDDQALAHYRKFLELDPNNAAGHWGVASVYQHQKKYDEAIKEFEIVRKLDPRTSFRLANLALVNALAGKRTEATTLLNQLLAMRKEGFVSSSMLAMIYSALGDSNRTFESLEQAYSARESLMPYIRRFDWPPPIRQDPRYLELIQRMNFPSDQ